MLMQLICRLTRPQRENGHSHNRPCHRTLADALLSSEETVSKPNNVN